MKILGCVAIGCLLLVSASVARGQQTPCSTPSCLGTYGQRPNQLPPTTIPGATEPEASPNSQVEQDQAKLRSLDRQKQIVADTQKLVSLANELKLDVDKSNKDTLSIDVIKKADEIEKLAHLVKEKMKGS